MNDLIKVFSIVLLSSLCSAADVRDYLVGVDRSTVHLSFLPKIEEVWGSGICIDPKCSVIATPYHGQMLVGRANLGVVGSRTKKVLSLANESDTNKAAIPHGKRILSFNMANDISFLYTKKPVSHKSGAPYSFKCYVGETVDIAGYDDQIFHTRKARIIGLNVTLLNAGAELKENLILDNAMAPGTSGSAVFDETGNLLGMIVLSGPLKFGKDSLAASVALPVKTIAKALVKLDPPLGSVIFPDIPEEAAAETLIQSSPEPYEETDLRQDTSPLISGLSAFPREVPNAIGRLRNKAAAASKVMENLIANQCLVQGTQEPLCHEVSVVGGQQSFRKRKANGTLGTLTTNFPIQKHGVWTLSDWADTLGEVADNSWVFQGSMDDHYLFTFRATAADDRCYYEEHSRGIPLFGGGHGEWAGPVACFEQVLTDKEFNIVTVFAEMIPPDGCLTEVVETAIYYDWVTLEGWESPKLLPIMEKITAKVEGQKHLWYATISWTDYKQFRAEHKIKF